jgi:hypothetical protein
VVLIVVLGLFVAGLHTLFALQTSYGDWQRFWLGHQAEGFGED